MRIFRIQIVFETEDEEQTEETMRERVERMLEGTGFGVAGVVCEGHCNTGNCRDVCECQCDPCLYQNVVAD
jgi:hypothetical protein